MQHWSLINFQAKKSRSNNNRLISIFYLRFVIAHIAKHIIAKRKTFINLPLNYNDRAAATAIKLEEYTRMPAN